MITKTVTKTTEACNKLIFFIAQTFKTIERFIFPVNNVTDVTENEKGWVNQ
jgi:hypothetical protein